MAYELIVTPKGEYQLTNADSEVLSGFFAYVDEVKAKEKNIKEELTRQLEKLYLEKGVNNIDSKEIKITLVPASTSTKFDEASFKKDYPDLHAKYVKTSNRKASIRVTLRSEEEETDE